MIFYNYSFYDDLNDIIEQITPEVIKNGLDENGKYLIEIEHCDLEPVVDYEKKIEEILTNALEERDTEDGDAVSDTIDLIRKHTDFKAIEKGMRQLWFPNGKRDTVDLVIELIIYLEENGDE